MGSEYDSAEEVTAARWDESPRCRRTTTEGDGITREVVHDLIEEFLGKTRDFGAVGRGPGSDSTKLGRG